MTERAGAAACGGAITAVFQFGSRADKDGGDYSTYLAYMDYFSTSKTFPFLAARAVQRRS